MSSSGWSAAWAHSSRARQTAASLGLALSQRVSRSPASSNRPERVARSAMASQTRSSSGAIDRAFSSVPRIPSIGYGSWSRVQSRRRVSAGSRECSKLAAQKAAVLVVPPGDPVQVSEKPSGLLNVVAVPAAGAVKARLGEPVVAGVNGGPAARQRREGRLGRQVRDTAPGRHGGVRMALSHFASAKQVLDFALARPPIR